MKKHSVIVLALSVLITFATAKVVRAAVPSQLSTATTTNAFGEGERVVYGRVVEAYRKNHLSEAIQQRQILARHYPKSIHLDNAYYLTGVLEFQAGRYAEAVRDFGIVEDNFQHSNKRAAAMFAKAHTYKMLGLQPQATRLLNLIVKEYPGSPESQRAWMQLKVAAMESTKKNVRK